MKRWIAHRRGSAPRSAAWWRLYGAFVVSGVGDEFTRIALFAKVHELGGDISSFTLLALSQALPAVAVSPVAGALSDRGHKRAYLVVADAARCLLMVFAALSDSPGQVLASVALNAAFTSLFRPVEASLEVDLLRQEELLQASSIRFGTRQVLMIVGPALVGTLLWVIPVWQALLVDAASYAASALVLLTVPRVAARAPDVGRGDVGGQMKEALLFILRSAGLRWLLLAAAALVLLMGMQGPLFFDFVVTRLGGGAEGFSALMTALGIGAVAGALLLNRLSFPREDGGLYVLTAVLALDALALFAFTFGGTLLACMAAMAVMGLISAAFQIIVRVQFQSRPPARLRGGALGWLEAVQAPLSAASLVIALPLVSRWSSAEILRGAAVAEFAVAGVGLAMLRCSRAARRP